MDSRSAENGAATEPRGAAKNVVHSSILLWCRPCASYESAFARSQKARTLWTLFPPPFPSHDWGRLSPSGARLPEENSAFSFRITFQVSRVNLESGGTRGRQRGRRRRCSRRGGRACGRCALSRSRFARRPIDEQQRGAVHAGDSMQEHSRGTNLGCGKRERPTPSCLTHGRLSSPTAGFGGTTSVKTASNGAHSSRARAHEEAVTVAFDQI